MIQIESRLHADIKRVRWPNCQKETYYLIVMILFCSLLVAITVYRFLSPRAQPPKHLHCARAHVCALARNLLFISSFPLKALFQYKLNVVILHLHFPGTESNTDGVRVYKTCEQKLRSTRFWSASNARLYGVHMNIRKNIRNAWMQ